MITIHISEPKLLAASRNTGTESMIDWATAFFSADLYFISCCFSYNNCQIRGGKIPDAKHSGLMLVLATEANSRTQTDLSFDNYLTK